MASELNVSPEVVQTFEERLAAGDPIPYLARRFPDQLAGLDVTVLRRLRTRIEEAREIELRRANVLKSLEGEGAGNEKLRKLAETVTDRYLLDDVAAHHRKHKGTRGSEAIGKGLEPLADLIEKGTLEGKSLEEAAAPFVSTEKDKEVPTAQDALHGAQAILAERYSAEPEVRARVRREMRDRGEIVSKVFDSSKPGADRYKEFFDFRERGKALSGRRYLKLRQGEREKVIKFSVELQFDNVVNDLEPKILGVLAEGANDNDKALHEFKKSALRDAVKRILPGAIELDVRTEWKERADHDAIQNHLKKNIRQLCFRAPFGPRVVVGVDPALRKGLRAVVVNAEGGYVADATYALEGEQRAAAIESAREWLRKHKVEGIAVSNDNESNESYRFFREVVAGMGGAPAEAAEGNNNSGNDNSGIDNSGNANSGNGTSATDANSAPGAGSAADSAADSKITASDESADAKNTPHATNGAEASGAAADATVASDRVASDGAASDSDASGAAAPVVVRVPEVGAAAIANSPQGREEFGDQPVPVRAAVSMARRLQDPLSEYVRVEPKVLSGFHHGLDIAKGRLERLLTEEIENCVHEIPIDLNRAPVTLLAWVGNMGIESAKKIGEWRKANGSFASRVGLALVGLDESAYQRSVAFLRVYKGADPLDETGVHPDHAAAVESLVKAAGVGSVGDLTNEALSALSLDAVPADAPEGTNVKSGILTFVRDLLLHTRKDPRGGFVATVYNDGVRSISQLKAGQELEGIVRGLAPFGVFVDIGVSQDGLLHVSELANHFVKDPSEIVKVGDRVKVRVINIDPVKRKVALTMRSEEDRQAAEQARAAERAERKAAQKEQRDRAKERRLRARDAAEARKRGESAPAGAPGSGGFQGRPARPAPAPVRAASVRRDGVTGGKPRRGGPMDRRGRRPGGRDDREELLTAEAAGGDKPKAADAPPPPANPFKRFFQAHGLLES